MKIRDLVEKSKFTKDYSNKSINMDVFVDAIDVANGVQGPGNYNPIYFVIIDDPEKIAIVAQACQQSFITKAPYIIIASSDVTQIERLYDNKAQKYLKHHVGSVIQTLRLQLAESGVSTSLVAPFTDMTLHHEIGIPDGREIETIITAGQGLGKVHTRKNPSLINKIFFNSWGHKWYGEKQPEVTRKDM